MAFCRGAWSAVKDLWDHVTPVLETTINEIMAITGAIKKLETNPTVEAIVAIIPSGTQYEAILNTALGTIEPALQTAEDIATKISTWLAGKTQLQVNANLIKLASVATAIADTEPAAVKGEKFYDAAVQLKAVVG